MPAKMTTEEFITKAKLVHGDKYDYSKTDLDNRDEKGRVCIICHEKDEKGVEHGEFWQKPVYHLGSSGCTKCKMRKLKLSVFLRNSKLCQDNKQELENLLQGTPWKLIKYFNKRKANGFCTKHNNSLNLIRETIKKGSIPCEECAQEMGRKAKSAIKKLREIHFRLYVFTFLFFYFLNASSRLG